MANQCFVFDWFVLGMKPSIVVSTETVLHCHWSAISCEKQWRLSRRTFQINRFQPTSTRFSGLIWDVSLLGHFFSTRDSLDSLEKLLNLNIMYFTNCPVYAISELVKSIKTGWNLVKTWPLAVQRWWREFLNAKTLLNIADWLWVFVTETDWFWLPLLGHFP